MSEPTPFPTRRGLLRGGSLGFAALALGRSPVQAAQWLGAPRAGIGIGPLGPPDANGIRLPAGFSSRVVAVSGQRVRLGNGGRSSYLWHIFPDGAATFTTPDGGWVYVSNSESISILGAGAGVLRFARDGSVVDAYRILGGTQANCAGGPTPWETWLSCEEIDFGQVHECYPLGGVPAVVRPALGRFKHEAAAVDPWTGIVYMTEDESDGRLYRFVPANAPTRGSEKSDLTRGTLEVARWSAATGEVKWLAVPNPTPNPLQTPTRQQVPASTPFRGGEGMWHHDGKVWFTTKGDNRVWCLELDRQELRIVYDAATSPTPVLTGVDNVTVSARGNALVGEDGGDMQIVVVDAKGRAEPLVEVVGQSGSEITGPVFSPDGSRLYFSSQRGSTGGGGSGLGVTYEISGPFAALSI